MISVNELSVVFGDRVLFNKASFFVAEKDRIGLVGKNGAGKSTMLKLLIGQNSPTGGTISIPRGKTLGYLPQQMKHNDEAAIIDEASKAFEEINTINDRLDAIGVELGERDDYESDGYSRLIQELNDLNDRLVIMETDNLEEKAERVLKGLGFVQEELHRPMGEFSGGWKMRVELAKILLQAPDILLLDEPTNHLDIESIEWLETFLKNYPGCIMLISHDRDFLDNITNRTIEISKGRIYDYRFHYSKYLVQRTDELEKQMNAYKNQQKEIAETKDLINKFRAKKAKAAFAQSLIKKLEKMDIIEVDDFDSTKINITFPPAPHSGKVVVQTEELAKTYGDKQIFSDVNMIITKQEKIALVGKNGVGKTTLLKILTGQEQGTAGEFKLGHAVDMGYFAQDEAEKLDENATVFETIDNVAVGDIRTQVRNILGSFLFGGDDIDKKVKVLSGGERTRLAICKLLFHPYNLLILDEPTNHLDLQSKDVLKTALRNFDGTLIIVSHDRNFLHGLANDIFELTRKGIKHFVGDIYDFLAEKRAASIAEFEQGKAKAKSMSTSQAKPKKRDKQGKKDGAIPAPKELSYAERKEQEKAQRKIKNKIQRTEKEIEETEAKLKSLNEVIATLDYSDPEAAQKTLDEYEQLKSHAEWLMTEWESAERDLAAF